MARKPIIISEFGFIEEYRKGCFRTDRNEEVSARAFDNLWEFSHTESKEYPDIDKVFRKVMKGPRRCIKAQNYVGTIQTKDGSVFEILPKIYSKDGIEEKDDDKSRLIFLKMLSALREVKGLSFQELGLSTRKGFPILETYIANYLAEAETICQAGLSKNYVKVADNERFLKGRLLVKENIRRNSTDMSRFYVQYQRFEENIPQNRLMVSTLQKLRFTTHYSQNLTRINMLLEMLTDIPASTNIEQDVRAAENSDRMMDRYRRIVEWSREILLGNGFTTFSGDCVNQALLFPAEKLFESFIAKLLKSYFRKNLSEFSVKAQHTAYYLVDKHREHGRFQMRPDIFIETKSTEDPFRLYQSIILDTKWKNLNAERPDKNYLMDIQDMYQLFAYGKKYQQHKTHDYQMPIVPKLVLLYPCSSKFNKGLPDYIYEEAEKNYNLRLIVEPFDLTGGSDKTNVNDYEKQIEEILKRAYKEILLVGCYKSAEHKDWILRNRLYNVRADLENGGQVRHGAVRIREEIFAPSKLLLYNEANPDEYSWFDIITTETDVVDSSSPMFKDYPGKSDAVNSYVLYRLRSELDADSMPAISPKEIAKLAIGVDITKSEVQESKGYVFHHGAPIYIDNYTDFLPVEGKE